jgi:nucleoside-diphosphate-sugar epimerase
MTRTTYRRGRGGTSKPDVGGVAQARCGDSGKLSRPRAYRLSHLGSVRSALQVLVIGGTGFIGRRAVDALRERGHDVWTLGRASAEGQHLLADRSRPNGLSQALAGRRFEAIVDLAAFQPREVEEAVELLQDSVRRYVLVSSGAVYQRGTHTTSDEEQHPR